MTSTAVERTQSLNWNFSSTRATARGNSTAGGPASPWRLTRKSSVRNRMLNGTVSSTSSIHCSRFSQSTGGIWSMRTDTR